MINLDPITLPDISTNLVVLHLIIPPSQGLILKEPYSNLNTATQCNALCVPIPGRTMTEHVFEFRITAPNSVL